MKNICITKNQTLKKTSLIDLETWTAVGSKNVFQLIKQAVSQWSPWVPVSCCIASDTWECGSINRCHVSGGKLSRITTKGLKISISFKSKSTLLGAEPKDKNSHHNPKTQTQDIYNSISTTAKGEKSGNGLRMPKQKDNLISEVLGI